MILSLKKRIKEKYFEWIRNRHPSSNSQQLNTHQIYIFPSAFGWLFGFVTLSIAIGAINYQLNAAYFLVFLMVTVGIFSMWQTHNNLKEINIRCQNLDDVEQGSPATVTLLIKGGRLNRYGYYFKFSQNDAIKIEEINSKGTQAQIPLMTSSRGKFNLPPIKVYSYFPLGIFQVWSYLYFEKIYYVYPKPVSPGFWPDAISLPNQPSNSKHLLEGDDELYELKSTNNPWIQPGRIAWKVSARGQGLYLKTMTSPAGEYRVFKLSDFSDMDYEHRLQALSYWIQAAEENNQIYRLELQQNKTQLSTGEEHMKTCLRLLATFKPD